jgi:hypothetical protein
MHQLTRVICGQRVSRLEKYTCARQNELEERFKESRRMLRIRVLSSHQLYTVSIGIRSINVFREMEKSLLTKLLLMRVRKRTRGEDMPSGLDENIIWRNREIYEQISFEVKLPSACSFIVNGLAFCCRCSHYMFRPTWPSSGVYDISLKPDRQQGKARKPNTQTRIWKLTETQQTNTN